MNINKICIDASERVIQEHNYTTDNNTVFELTKKDLIKTISTHYSEEIEDFKITEEYAEVIDELVKYKKGNPEPLKLASEFADLLNVIEHIAFQKKLDMDYIHKVQQEKRIRECRRIMLVKGEF